MDFQFVSDAAKKRPRVLQDYEFNENVRIGRGSYGQVYKARKIAPADIFQFYAVKEVELSSYSPSTCREISVNFNFFHVFAYSKFFHVSVGIVFSCGCFCIFQIYRELKHRNIMDLLKVYFSHAAQKVSPINYLIIAKWHKTAMFRLYFRLGFYLTTPNMICIR